MDLAGRAHQPPGRLVDEDALRGRPLAQRTGQGQSGVAFLVGELVRLEEPLHCRRREDGLRLAHQVRHWPLRHSFGDSESRCQKGDAGSRLRYAQSLIQNCSRQLT